MNDYAPLSNESMPREGDTVDVLLYDGATRCVVRATNSWTGEIWVDLLVAGMAKPVRINLLPGAMLRVV